MSCVVLIPVNGLIPVYSKSCFYSTVPIYYRVSTICTALSGRLSGNVLLMWRTLVIAHRVYRPYYSRMTELLVFPIFMAAAFTQAVAGFGAALLTMPLLIALLGIHTAAPLFALVIVVSEVIMIIRYRHALNLRDVWRLAVGSAVGIPLGVTALSQLPEDLVLGILGILVIVYALYTLLGPDLPELKRRGWGFAFGFVSGLFSGAYNTGGPPYVVYGTMSRWQPHTFKSNLQGVFLFSGLFVVTTHILSHNVTETVLGHALLALPGMLLGLLIGFSLDRFINPVVFRRIVLVLLVFLGLRLVF